MTRMLVDLPAPLGPRNPVTRPGLATKEMSSTAVKLSIALGHVLERDHLGAPARMRAQPWLRRAPRRPSRNEQLGGVRSCAPSCQRAVLTRLRPGWLADQTSYDVPGVASSTLPSYSSTASPRTTCGSCHGGMCVSSRRRDAGVGGRAPGLGPGQVQVGRVGRALEERRLAEEQVGVAGGVVEARGRRRCRPSRPGCGPRPRSARRTPSPGARPRRAVIENGPNSTLRAAVGDEVELLVHPRVLVEVVGLRHPAGACRPGRRRGSSAAHLRGGTCASRSSRTGRGSGRRAGGRGRRRRSFVASAYLCSDPSAPLPRSSRIRHVRPSSSASRR